MDDFNSNCIIDRFQIALIIELTRKLRVAEAQRDYYRSKYITGVVNDALGKARRIFETCDA